MKIEIYKSKGSQPWRWRVVGGNGEIMAHGEGYSSRAACLKTLQKLFGRGNRLHTQIGALANPKPRKNREPDTVSYDYSASRSTRRK